MGIDYFWVKQVEHSIAEGEPEIVIWLEGGFVNKYREMALDKAIFLELMESMATYDHYRFQIDDRLKNLPIHK